MAYLAVQVVCTVILTCGVEVVSTDQTFHRLEFGATFVFALVTTFSLVCSPERDFCSPLLLKFLVFANVGARATRERPGCVGGREWHAGAAVPRPHRRCLSMRCPRGGGGAGRASALGSFRLMPLRCALSSRDVRWWLSPTALPPHPAGNTLVSFLLVLVNLERFETASHQIEYANELTMAGAESAARGGGCP